MEIYEQIQRHAHYIKGKVLDIGSGSFLRYKHLFNFDEYITMDIKPVGVDIVGRIENIPLTDNTFDSIVCTQVLGDVFELNKAFKEMYRILRPNGVLMVTESLFDPLHDEPNDYWRFTPYSLRRLAEKVGFRVILIEGRGGKWSVIGGLKIRYWKNRLNPHSKWFGRLLSLLFKAYGTLMKYLDEVDSDTSYVNGYILICSK